jgi:hypothetical protein
MSYQRLYLWVEGVDDARFFEKIVKPYLSKTYDTINIIEYAQLKKKKVNDFIKSINSMEADYIFLADIDLSPCITQKKSKVKRAYRTVDENKIVVVIREIEAWYLAGLSLAKNKKLGIKNFSTTDNVNKEIFNNLIPNRFDSRIEFMLEILSHFLITEAKRKNKSFKYLTKKLI